jgi:hypothetical protein
MKIQRTLAFICSAALSVSLSSAVGLPHVSIPKLVADSDLVAIVDVGPATKIEGKGMGCSEDRALGTTYMVQARILQLIKGSEAGTVEAFFDLPKSFMGYRGINE